MVVWSHFVRDLGQSDWRKESFMKIIWLLHFHQHANCGVLFKLSLHFVLLLFLDSLYVIPYQ